MRDIEDEDLAEAYKAIEDPRIRERLLAARMSKSGIPADEIARLLCRGRPTINRWVAWLRDKGVRALIDGPDMAPSRREQEILQLYRVLSSKDRSAILTGEPVSARGMEAMRKMARERGWRGGLPGTAGAGPAGDPQAGGRHADDRATAS